MVPLEYNNIANTVKSILSFIISPQLQEKLFVVKLTFIGLTILFAVTIVYLCLHTSYLKIRYGINLEDFNSFYNHGQDSKIERWSSIKKRLQSDSPSDYKLAVVEAMNFLDDTLQRLGYGKKNIEERLQVLSGRNISTFFQLSKAFKVYEDILRDPDFSLPKAEALQIVNTIEKTLIELEVF
ncbi:hypothetical protein J7J81_01945 [bacterium]|nr:hypothetical protein [bacterium]